MLRRALLMGSGAARRRWRAICAASTMAIAFRRACRSSRCDLHRSRRLCPQRRRSWRAVRPPGNAHRHVAGSPGGSIWYRHSFGFNRCAARKARWWLGDIDTPRLRPLYVLPHGVCQAPGWALSIGDADRRELDAIYSPPRPTALRSGERTDRPPFPDIRAIEQDDFRRTGASRRSTHYHAPRCMGRDRWLARSLTNSFIC